MDISQKVSRALCSLKEKKPLVHQITNYVTANDCANITLAIGALPVMADCAIEVEEMTASAQALVINLGTLNQGKLESMLIAGKKANELGIPVILDPVGVGVTLFRKKAANTILKQIKLAVIRGNLSEIKTLNGANAIAVGVEAKAPISIQNDNLSEGIQIAKELAQNYEVVVAITGEVDVITDGQRIYHIENGCSIMSMVTGTGCMCSALIGAYSGALSDYFIAAIAGVVSIGVAGEVADKKVKSNAEGIGSFKVRLIDEIYFLTEDEIIKKARIY